MRTAIAAAVAAVLCGCGGKVVVDGGSASGGGSGGGGAPSCLADVDLPIDGAGALEGPAPLASAGQYPLLRGLHAGQPEGERYEVQTNGHLVEVDAVLFATDDAGDVIADVSLVCDGTRTAVASSRAPKSTLPDYDGIHSDLWVTRFVLDAPVPLEAGAVLDVLFHPEGADVVSGVAADVYAPGHMIGEDTDLSGLGDFGAQLLID